MRASHNNVTIGAIHGVHLGGTTRMESWEVWLCAFGFVTIINLSSIMGILFTPLMKRSYYAIIMRTMIGLAIGSLSGSALFHLIPAAFRLDTMEKTSGSPDYLNIALIVWVAAWLVMIVECVIKICVKMRASSKVKSRLRDTAIATSTMITAEGDGEAKRSISDVINTNTNDDMDKDKDSAVLTEKSESVESEALSNLPPKTCSGLPIYRSTLSLKKVVTELETSSKCSGTEDSQPDTIKTVAWIIIIGDSLHNFIDGVSIGTAFSKNFHTGAILSLAIMCEEFPHELGDFAILINSGLTVRKALLFNFLSALTCYFGMALGILLGEISWDGYIFAFAAGIFLYVSLGDMVPEVTGLVDEVSNVSPVAAFKVLVNHNVGILAGVIILYVLAIYQP